MGSEQGHEQVAAENLNLESRNGAPTAQTAGTGTRGWEPTRSGPDLFPGQGHSIYLSALLTNIHGWMDCRW